jgi:hypothetical protein
MLFSTYWGKEKTVTMNVFHSQRGVDYEPFTTIGLAGTPAVLQPLATILQPLRLPEKKGRTIRDVGGVKDSSRRLSEATPPEPPRQKCSFHLSGVTERPKDMKTESSQ